MRGRYYAQIVYPICCGHDVHRDFVYACIAATEKGVTTYKRTPWAVILAFGKQLQGCLYGIYRKTLDSHIQYPLNWLQSCLEHPKHVKAIRGKNTDKRNAKWIADIFKHNLVSGSFISPADRDLNRYHTKLTNFTTGEKNRAQNYLTVSNLNVRNTFHRQRLQEFPHWLLLCVLFWTQTRRRFSSTCLRGYDR